MATNPRSRDELEYATRNDAGMKSATADDLRVRRAAEPDVIPAPQEPMNAPTVAPEVDRGTAIYERPRRRFGIRGGVSLPAAFTGALVAMGAMVLFLSITAGALAAEARDQCSSRRRGRGPRPMTTGDDRLAVERAEPRPSEAVPDEDQMKTERAYREQTGPDGDRKPSGSERPKDTARKEDEDIDEALDETF